MVTEAPEKDLVEQLMEAEEATLPKVEVVPGTEKVPEMSVRELRSAGWVYIWDNRTGERSLTNRNMLPDQLKKKRPDGSKVFTTLKPAFEPRRGTHKCLLHPDNPNRQHYDEIGLPTCRKSNLTSDFQVNQHMRTKHRMEFATIVSENESKEKQEERLLRLAMLKNQLTINKRERKHGKRNTKSSQGNS